MLIPGDKGREDVTVWPVAPLEWWRGKNSYFIRSSAASKLNFADEESKELNARMGWNEEIVADMENGDPYNLALRDAIKAFFEYAEIGQQILDQQDYSIALNDFLYKYGAPVDYDRGREEPFSYYGNVLDNATQAAICMRLFDHVKHGRYSKIQDMAHIEDRDDGVLVTFFPGEGFGSNVNFRLNTSKDNITSAHWTELAEKSIRETSSNNAPYVSLKEEKTAFGSQLVIVPNGLETSMWLAFRLHINDELQDKEITKTCLSHGKYHGCGRQFVPESPRDRLCPDCRKKAKTEAQRAWRERKKKEAASADQ